MSALPKNRPDPLQDPEICEQRGYHGPFARTETYDRLPEWKGMGECTMCGSCRHVPTEEARRRATLGAEPRCR